jgi:hypothetical protein
MTNRNNDIEELEELLTELEGQEAQIVTPYSEEDDAVTRLMDAPLGDQDWMVQVTALDRRMMSTSQVINELSLGKISQRTLVWRGGMDDWMPLSRVDELSRASAPPPSAVPQRSSYQNLAPPPPPPVARVSQPAWSSPSNAPLPPPPVAIAPSLGLAPPPAMGMSSRGMPSSVGLPPPPAPSGSNFNAPKPVPMSAPMPTSTNSQGITTRPVAVDFSDVSVEQDAPMQSKRWVMALSAVAILAVFVTVYSLSSGGGDSEAKESAAAQPQAVSALQPASSAAKEKPSARPAAVEKAVAEKAPEKAEPAPVAASKRSDEDESAAEESGTASASARQTAPARYSPRSDWRRRSRSGSGSSEASSRSDNEQAEEPTPARASAPTRAAALAPTTPAKAEDEEAPSSEPVAAVAEEVDEAPKSTGKASSNTFNREAAKSALDEAASQAKNCRPQGGPSGTGRVQIRYEPSGRVANVAILTSKFDNTTAGSCVRMLFRRAKVPEFTGAPVVVVNKSFEIP